MKKILYILVFIFIGFNANTQSLSEIGLPFIQNYTPDDYAADSQNWAVVQSNEGFMYFGNNEGILEYDGVSWRLIQLPNLGRSLSLAVTKENRIYVGGDNELGYLEADAFGKLQFVSLKKYLPKTNQEFQYIRSISIIENTIYFQSRDKIFQWNNEAFKILNPKIGFNFSKAINDDLYVIENNVIIRKLVDDKFEDVANASSIKAQVIVDIVPLKENQLLVLTLKKGLFILDKGNFTPFNTASNNYLTENFARRIKKLSNGWYIIGTYNGGVALLDADGNFIKAIDKIDGLINNYIVNFLEDKQKGVWLTTNYGISRIELLSPYTIFDERHGLNGYVNRIFRHKEKLYVANFNGVLSLAPKGDLKNSNIFKTISESFFSKAKNPSIQAFYFIAINDSLFSASRAGMHIIVDHQIVQKFNYKSSALMRSKTDPNRIYIGLDDGLASIKYNNRQWIDDGRINGIKDDIREIVEDKNGNLWLESQTDGVWKVSFSKSYKNPDVKHFRANKELPSGVLFLKFVNGDVLFTINNHAYKYIEEQDSIVANPSFGKTFGLFGEISVKKEDENGDLWMFAQLEKEDEKRSRIKATKQPNGSYVIKKIVDERISLDVNTAHFTDKNNVVWYGGSDGIIRHDLNIESTSEHDFNTHIRKVVYQSDSLLFGGVKTEKKSTSTPYKNNAFRFEFAATSYDDESKNEYQYMLEGFDENWSSWSLETQKDYTNIPEGDYHFKVRSKNVFNHIGEDDSYSFTVLPPWYRTWWMYLLYGLGIIALLSLILQWRSKELRRKNENLENLVAERTTEIHHKNELLMHQTEKLVQIDEAKTELYANITHEFRTPLTVILGMADTLKSNVKNNHFEDTDKSLEMIRRNGKNLLQLVNEMLDLAKVESGSMDLNLVQTDAIPFVKYLSESFHSLAESKKIDLTVYSEIDTLEMDIDVNKMASIVSNLLSNAIKFTSANGKIFVHLNKIQTKDGEFLSIKFKDTGLGLTENDITHLFDRFYQVDDVSSQKRSGTGIGLSLAKEFVELMNGTIDVESTLGKGSTFTVQIPITNNAVKTVDAKITVEPPIKKTSNSTKTESTVLDEGSVLPLALIVEDNEDVAHYLKACLKGKYQTIHAINGNLGIDMAYEKIPDIIISDVMMPGKDGFEVCAALKSDERTDHIPIILLTAKVTTEDRLTGLAHGADAYLAKPFNKKELFIRLDQLVLVRKKLIDKIQKEGFIKFLNNRAENPETKFLQKVIKLVDEEISNATFGASDLASKLHLSESQVYKKLKAITDKSTAVFIRSIRLQKAKELLQTTNKTISEIAYEVGFNDPSWFSRAFKEEFGFAPSDFLK